LDKAIRIGELLVKCKQGLPHSEWMPWMKINLKFGHATASNYMKMFEEHGQGKLPTVGNLKGLYYPQVEHKPDNQQEDVLEAEVVSAPEPTEKENDTKTEEGKSREDQVKEEPVYSKTEFPETSALKEGQSRNLALLKDAWLRANKEDRKRDHSFCRSGDCTHAD